MAKKIKINFCEICNGYTNNEKALSCPQCGRPLMIKRIDEEKLRDYKNLDGYLPDDPSDDPPSNNPPELRTPDGRGKRSLSGIVYNYSNSDVDGSKYSRLFVKKIWDAVFYRQRMEDVIHYFRLHTETGKDEHGMPIARDIHVNAHGTIVRGAHLADNQKVTVTGKFRNGVLMASDIVDTENRSHVVFRRSLKAVFLLSAVSIILLLAILFAVSHEAALPEVLHMAEIFFVLWVVVFLILLVLYGMFSFSKFGMMKRLIRGKENKTPWIRLLLASLLITIFIFMVFPEWINSL